MGCQCLGAIGSAFGGGWILSDTTVKIVDITGFLHGALGYERTPSKKCNNWVTQDEVSNRKHARHACQRH